MEQSEKEALILIFSAALIGFSLYNFMQPTSQTLPGNYAEAHEIQVEDNRLSLHTGCHILDMGVSEQQIDSVQLGLSNQSYPHRLTHDLTVDILREFEGDIRSVKIHSLEDGRYRSYLILGNGERLDSRPSDAVALAVRTDSPVYVERGVLHRNSEFLCENYI